MAPDEPPPPPPSIASRPNPFATGRSLILLQLLSRLLTFALNQSLVRLAPPEVFGTAAIQFDLICSTVLFLSREGIRNALLRGDTADSNSSSDSDSDPTTASTEPIGSSVTPTSKATPATENEQQQSQRDALARIPLRFGIVIATLVTAIYLITSSRTTTSQPVFHLSLALYIISALLELAIEPLYIRALRSNPPRLRVRVQAEGGMAIVKSMVTFGFLLLFPEIALLGFALGQCAGAGWLMGRYVWEYGWGAVLPGVLKSKPLGAPPSKSRTYTLAMANTRQSVIKHLLTEADRIAVGRISPLSDQGGYAVAMNYGSLIARILFQPLEETLLLHFSSSLQSSSPSSATLQQFTYIVHLSVHLLLLLPSFVPPLLPAIIPLLLPRRYLSTSAPTTLETYLTWYIPLLSLNGILEAFHASSATPEEVKRQAKFMVASSAGFAGVLYLLTKTTLAVMTGMTTEQSLIIASCAAMALRIGYAFRHARRYFAARGGALRTGDIMPHAAVMGISIASGLILRVLQGNETWQSSWKGWAQLVGVGGVLGLSTLGVMWWVERPRLAALRRTMGGKSE